MSSYLCALILSSSVLLAAVTAPIIPPLVPSANKQGTGLKFQLSTGVTVNGNCGQYDADGNIVDSGSPCGAISQTLIYTSNLVKHAPCNLSTGLLAGGGACPDDTAAINAVLATATADNPITLIQDIGSSITGIQIPTVGFVTIDCQNWSNGYFIASGSNADGIRNRSGANGYGTNTTPPTPSEQITLRNCRLNGNRGNGTTGNSTSGNARQAANGNWLNGIMIQSANKVRFLNNWISDAPSFAIWCNSCSDVIFDGNRLDASPSFALNQDGIHVTGPSSQIRVSDNWCNTTDDCIAVNANEGYGGPVDGVAVTNSQCVGCLTGYRQMSNNGIGTDSTNKAVKNVTISNYAGTIASTGGIIGVAFRLGEVSSVSKAVDIMQDVAISNVHFSSASSDAYMIEINDNLGKLDVNGLTWDSPVGANAMVNFRSGSVVSSLSLRGVRISRTSTGNAAAYLLNVPSGDTVTNLHLDGVYVENQQGTSYSAIADLITVPSGGSIGSIDVGDIDPPNVTALASSGDLGRVTNVRGSGLCSLIKAGIVIPGYGAACGMVQIAAQTLASPSATVTFSAIPQSFTHLAIYITARCSASQASADFYLQFNGDTGANYSRQYLVATGSTTAQGQNTSQAQAAVGNTTCATALANAPSSQKITVFNYSGTTFNKWGSTEYSGMEGTAITSIETGKHAFYWASTTAINSITVGTFGTSFVAGSTFTLYGF